MTRTSSYLDRRQRARCTECGLQLELCKCEDPDEIADVRTQSDRGVFARQVAIECNQRFGNAERLYEELVFRVGEVGQKLVKHQENRTPASGEIYRDLVKLAAIVTLLAVDGTPEYAYPAG